MSTKADHLAAKFGANLSGIVGLRPTPPTSQPPTPADPSSAGKHDRATRLKSFGEFPIDQVDRDPTQPREDFDEGDLQRLADSIRRKGQLTPIRVRWNHETNRWVVLVGERRWRACKLAGLATIKVDFVEGPTTEADRLEEQIYENVARAAFKPAEEGKAYQRLMTLKGWTIAELIAELKVEPTSVHRALGLARLPDDVAALVDQGAIRPTAAYELSKLPDPDEVRTLAQAVIENHLGHKAVVEAVTRRKEAAVEAQTQTQTPTETPARAKSSGQGRGASKPQRPTFEVFRAGGGKVTVAFKKAVDARAILAALEEATARQREKVEAIEGPTRDVA